MAAQFQRREDAVPGGEGRRSEGTVIDPALEIVDLSRYLQIWFCRWQIWGDSIRSSLGDYRSEEILADPA